MKAHDREVAGIRCMQVLEMLGDYVDGDLDAGHRQQVDAHLAGCSWCERFGGGYAVLVAGLRLQGVNGSEPGAASPGGEA